MLTIYGQADARRSTIPNGSFAALDRYDSDRPRPTHLVWSRGAEETASACVADLDLLEHGAFICDRTGKILTANAAAEGLLSAAIGRDGRLALTRHDRVLAFAGLLEAALDPARAGESVAMGCELAASHVVLRAMKLRRDGRPGARAEVLVLVETRPTGPGERLRRDFGLTAAEVRVALALADGVAPEEIGVRQGIARTTIRSHLKAIYRKTETSGQVQLVLLVCGLRRSA